jgi:succinate dehydrogenase/fumarate reductase flavoprotein subunit
MIDEAMEMEADLVVVGLGTAALAAAIDAHDAGLEVVVLEKAAAGRAGGNSRVSGQVWFCPDDVEEAKVYLRALSGEYPLPEPLIDAWAKGCGQNTEWIAARAEEVRDQVPRDDGDPYTGHHTDMTQISHGAELRSIGWRDIPDEEFYELDGIGCGTDYHYFGNSQGWSRLWLTLKAAVDSREIPIHYETPATRLLTDQDGAVIGVASGSGDDERLFTSRRAVFLGTGGFANNPEMARSFLRLPSVKTQGSPENKGDGIKLAQKVGADLSHPFNYMSMPGIAMPPYEAGEFAQPREHRYILVGRDGRRFVDETQETRHGKISIRGEFDFFPGFPMWTIFDEDGRLAGPLVFPRENSAFSWNKQIERYEWSEDNSAEIERGWIVQADSIAELAEKLGLDRAGLEAQIELTNADHQVGEDSQFGRPVEHLVPIAKPPFYGYRWAHLLITTLGGIRKDEKARALDPFGEPIPRLYCAGDTASSYSWCLSGGLGLADAMVFGRIAAAEAAGLKPLSSEAAGLAPGAGN